MSDFVQTMKDWRRMCRTMEAEHPSDGCNHCPLLDLSPDWHGCDAIYADEFADNVDWRELEKRVTKWAAEHPDPVYPSYLEVFGWGHKKTWAEIKDILANPIPADIAQKLGIEPKEV